MVLTKEVDPDLKTHDRRKYHNFLVHRRSGSPLVIGKGTGGCKRFPSINRKLRPTVKPRNYGYPWDRQR